MQELSFDQILSTDISFHTDGLIGMAAASCVIGVTILKSQNVRFYRRFLCGKHRSRPSRFRYFIWSFWKSSRWWHTWDSVLWGQVDDLSFLSQLVCFIFRCNTLDVIDRDVFSVRTSLCFSHCDHLQLVIHVLHNHRIRTTFCEFRSFETRENDWRFTFSMPSEH